MEPKEAVAALGDIESMQRRTRARAQYKGADLIYAVWGVIWFVAFACQQFGGEFSFRAGQVSVTGPNILWTPLVLIGIVLSYMISRRRATMKDKNAWKFGVLWPIVFGYFYLWLFLLGPLFNHQMLMSEEGILHGTAVISTIPMCVYVLAGVMNGEYYIAWVGGAVTILTGVGLLVTHDYFYLWMAVFGGGGLLLAGYISNRKWKNA
jgi:hypothetical protein